MVSPVAIYAARVKGKRVVYLDTNAWSALAEASSTQARSALAIALEARTRGLAIFPLAYPAITELLKREVSADSVAQAHLMDVLSDGVAFRGYRHIRELEVKEACKFMLGAPFTTPRSEVFTITPFYVADNLVDFPDGGWNEKASDQFMLALEQSSFPGMRWLQQHMRKPEYLEHESETDERYVSNVSSKLEDVKNWATDASGRVSAAKLRVEEHQFVVNNYILASVRELLPTEDFVRVLPRLAELPKNPKAAREVVYRMPSVWLSCELNVQRLLASDRRVQKQDFYDHEHVLLGIPYADAFVTADGGIRDLLRRAHATMHFRCDVVATLKELEAYLGVLV